MAEHPTTCPCCAPAASGGLAVSILMWLLEKLIELIGKVIIPGLVGLCILLYRWHAVEILPPRRSRYRRRVHVGLRCAATLLGVALLVWPVWTGVLAGLAGAAYLAVFLVNRKEALDRAEGKPRRVKATWGPPVRTTTRRATGPAPQLTGSPVDPAAYTGQARARRAA